MNASTQPQTRRLGEGKAELKLGLTLACIVLVSLMLHTAFSPGPQQNSQQRASTRIAASWGGTQQHKSPTTPPLPPTSTPKRGFLFIAGLHGEEHSRVARSLQSSLLDAGVRIVCESSITSLFAQFVAMSSKPSQPELWEAMYQKIQAEMRRVMELHAGSAPGPLWVCLNALCDDSKASALAYPLTMDEGAAGSSARLLPSPSLFHLRNMVKGASAALRVLVLNTDAVTARLVSDAKQPHMNLRILGDASLYLESQMTWLVDTSADDPMLACLDAEGTNKESEARAMMRILGADAGGGEEAGRFVRFLEESAKGKAEMKVTEGPAGGGSHLVDALVASRQRAKEICAAVT